MSALKPTLKPVLLIALALSLMACDSQSSSTSGGPNGLPRDYETYHKDGVSLAHPDVWIVSFDDEPGLYADREVGLNVSGVSSFRLMIMEEERAVESAVALFERQLRLKESEAVQDYQRVSLTVGGKPAERLTWAQTLLKESNFELTIIDLPVKSGSAFAVFQLIEDDIEKYRADKARVAESITLN